MNSTPPRHEAEDEDEGFKPLTLEQASEWRKRHPSLSIWRLVAWQVVMGCAVMLLTFFLTRDAAATKSAAWGALCVVVPAALFARGVTRIRYSSAGALAALFVWEMAKIAITLIMLGIALRWLHPLNWLALLAAMVATMKTYWFVLLARPSVRNTID